MFSEMPQHVHTAHRQTDIYGSWMGLCHTIRETDWQTDKATNGKNGKEKSATEWTLTFDRKLNRNTTLRLKQDKTDIKTRVTNPDLWGSVLIYRIRIQILLLFNTENVHQKIYESHNIGAEAVLRIRNRRIRIISLDPDPTKTIENRS